MTHRWIIDNKCIKYCQGPKNQKKIYDIDTIFEHALYDENMMVKFEIWPWAKNMAHTLVVDRNSAKYNPYSKWQ